jgi:hypothetical protein
MDNRVQLLTPLTPEQCVSRLTAAIDPQGFKGLFGSKPVIGRVTTSSLRLRKRIRYRNSFQSYLTATMRKEGGGSVISGKIAMDPAVWVFLGVWLGLPTLFGGMLSIFAVASMISGHRQPNQWLGVIIPVGMIAFGLALVPIGRFLARNEGR